MTWQWKLWNPSLASLIYEDSVVGIWDDHLFVVCVASWALSRNVQSTWDLRRTLENMSDLCTFILTEDIIWTVLWFAEVTSVFFSRKGFWSNQFISSWTLSLPLHSSSSEKPKSAIFFCFFPHSLYDCAVRSFGLMIERCMIEFDGKEDYILRPRRESRDGFFSGKSQRGSLKFLDRWAASTMVKDERKVWAAPTAPLEISSPRASPSVVVAVHCWVVPKLCLSPYFFWLTLGLPFCPFQWTWGWRAAWPTLQL